MLQVRVSDMRGAGCTLFCLQTTRETWRTRRCILFRDRILRDEERKRKTFFRITYRQTKGHSRLKKCEDASKKRMSLTYFTSLSELIFKRGLINDWAYLSMSSIIFFIKDSVTLIYKSVNILRLMREKKSRKLKIRIQNKKTTFLFVRGTLCLAHHY